MKKKPHKLKENKRNSLPNHVILFDTETNQREEEGETIQDLRLGWACYWNVKNDSVKCQEFYKNETFWDFVERYAKNKRKLFVFAHNIGFDMLISNGYYELPGRGWEMKSFYDEGTAYISIWTKEKKTIVLLDSMNYFKDSLDNLGKQIGVLKGKVDFKTVTDSELSVYCKQDVEVLRQVLKNWFDFHNSHDLGNFAYTIAGQSLNTYRHKFMKHAIMIHDNERVYELERESYFGGRTEAFFIGKVPEKVYKFDFNSMYPGVMVDQDYPTKLIGYTEALNVKDLKRIITKYGNLVISKVRVKTDIPIFPVKRDNKLIFPVGEFTCTLATPELIEGINRGLVVEVLATSIYEKAKLFKDYVEFFYNKRLEAKALKQETYIFFYKLFLNSLYGKFGQLLKGWEIVGQTDDLIPKRWVDYDPETKERTTFRQFGGVIQEMKKEKTESPDSFPAIASHVTSYARLKLFKNMEIAGFPNNTFYCDTDSIFTNEAGAGLLEKAGVVDQVKLGMLGLEEVVEKVRIYGLKDYVTDKKTKTKGIKKNSIFKGETEEGYSIYEQDQWKRLSGLIAEGNISIHKIVKLQKVLTRKYDKGKVLPSGKVLPFLIDKGYLDILEGIEATKKKMKEFKKGTMSLFDPMENIYTEIIKRKIAPSKTGAWTSEYKNLPKIFKGKKGLPLDEFAGELGLSVTELLDKLENYANKDQTKNRYLKQIEELEEYKGMDSYLYTLEKMQTDYLQKYPSLISSEGV